MFRWLKRQDRSIPGKYGIKLRKGTTDIPDDGTGVWNLRNIPRHRIATYPNRNYPGYRAQCSCGHEVRELTEYLSAQILADHIETGNRTGD